MMDTLLAVAVLATMVALLGLLYRPLGDYMAYVYTTGRHWRVERWLYRLIGVDPDREQTWPAYLRAVLAFSAAGMILLYGMQRLQPWLPYSLGHESVSPDLAFNTAASFVANTNWQSYSPEHTMGFTVQAAGLGVQMFVSAAVGMAVAVALIRGIAGNRRGTLGNFWVDLFRTNLRILLPGAVLAALVFAAAGVVQNWTGFTDITTLAGNAQSLPGGPVASQEAIKMLATNGGGFFNANSAHPYENPTAWTNMFQIFLLLVIPFTLPRTVGRMVGDFRFGMMIELTMASLFTIAYALITVFEVQGSGTAPELAGAALEGKEVRLGIIQSTLFATATTGTSGGAANSMHGSYTALAGMITMLHMALGELSPGGVGAGIYAILPLVIIGVYIAALLLGRAPVMLGKRLGVREIKYVSIFILVMPVLALGALAISLVIPSIHASIINDAAGNTGTHGVSEVMYAFISAAVNNGSAFAGFNADTPYLNTVLGVLILLGRYIPIALTLALAGSFAEQDRAQTDVTELPLHTPQFVGLLVAMIAIVTLPTFLPLMTVGPLAEWLG
ncbi:MAG: potassium-transporting ATPase subunit KdpA [Propionibacteriaceae bacterium]|jgi:K+-transporting ATPase ATPase A chain|nr:potassium-transporting ATPase subunit KdpA [Propionibacteriaceae bacterium]